MNDQGVRTKAWYCSDEPIRGVKDKEFGVEMKWDIPLLDGYEYKFFKNHSWKPSHSKGFFGLINLGMVRQLFREPKSVIIVHGWHYCTHFLIFLLGKLKGHTICLRYEAPWKQEVLKEGWKQQIKKLALKSMLFPRIHYFLYIGSQNYLLYKNYGLPEKQLVFSPYAIDNFRFKTQSKQHKKCISQIKNKLGIQDATRIILFSGKYIDKKRPLDLLQAFSQINIPDCWLIMIGEGDLRKEMEAFIREKKLKRVILTGFVNQSSIAEYYAIGDVFVMCSGVGETWGLSVNEAMNFNLPVIVSDLTGCSDDLVKEGVNGYVFKTGNVDELAERLRQVLHKNSLSWKVTSENLIEEFNYSKVLSNICENIL